ncbi:dickkopf-related protein 2 [Astyanax mexicanus]|uniref:Dickkopf-related protein 2 n=2 Tax=Astyanax mexicanus TaxID=7994 RepID=A0A8B9HH38_ASTMX|nr:dickkopf-related protein 2 [Astyanax mexicanus]KAG9275622.1 dickkopf-related protein 2 [Astyanax mexicanus]
MLALTRRFSCCWTVTLLLATAASLGSSLATARHGTARDAENAIKSLPLGEAPTATTNRSGVSLSGVSRKGNVHPVQMYPCSSDKECSVGSYCHSPQHAPSRCLTCRRRKKRCNRDSMCCPGNRCSNYICTPFSESILSPHISPIEEHNKLSSKDKSWKRIGKAQAKLSLKGHDGDPCLRSSDCSEGYCCARHFWTKICKPVLRQGEVCTKQRKKGSHGLEIFQRCDCAKGLACKVWKDATSYSRSRLHVCQRI